MRGSFLKPRPPVQKKTLNFDNNAALQTLVTTGLFQGGGYYRPDFGTESLLAQIAGHLIQFIEVGGIWNVSDVSVPGSLNDPNATQVWMNQMEKWMGIWDGTQTLPIFFDGGTSRRSFGASTLWGTTALNFNPPLVGGTVQLTLTSPYIGQYNIPIELNGAFYQPIPTSTPSSYAAILTNVSDTPASIIGVGYPVQVIPVNVGFLLVDSTQMYETGYGLKLLGYTPFIVDGNLPLLPVGTVLSAVDSVFGIQSTLLITSVGKSGTNTSYGVELLSKWTFDMGFAHGTLVQLASTSQPTVSLGTIQAAYTVPATDANVTVQLSQLYSGANNQPVWINGQQYVINPAQLAPPGDLLTLINLTDTTTIPVVAPSPIYSVPELPAGRMGAYGLGRQWLTLTDGLSFIAGDIVGGPSGTQANNFRDSVLKVTENNYLLGGGAFRVPGNPQPLTNGAFGLPNSGDLITAMIFAPTLDMSLGQGALEVFTGVNCFTCQAPTDRSTWQTLTNPILTEALKDKGAIAQNSTVSVNSDTFFRTYDGLGSLILARRDFEVWGNKSISNELQRVLNNDNQSLLPYGSAITFDNRFLSTAAPNVSPQGVFHIGLVSLNLDLLSSLRAAAPPAWESVWTGINALQILSGRVNGSKRAFAFTVNVATSQLELYELLPENTTAYQDNGDIPILWLFETPIVFNSDIKPMTELVQLEDGEVYLSEIQGTVQVNVYYKPDFYPCWTLWRGFTVCTDSKSLSPGYRMRVGLGSPDVTPCEPTNNRPLRNGYFFQLRVEVTGSCVWNGARVSAVSIPQTEFAKIECSPMTCQLIACTPPDDLRLYNLQGLPPSTAPVPPPAPSPFVNETVYFTNLCASGMPTFTGLLPNWMTFDSTNNQFIGKAGVIGGNTQANANANAQLALNQFVQANFANGNITCATAGLLNVYYSSVKLTNGGNATVFTTSDVALHLNPDNPLAAPTINSITLTTGYTVTELFAPITSNIVTLPINLEDATVMGQIDIFLSTPASTGVTGTLTIVHTGTNSPFVVYLTT